MKVKFKKTDLICDVLEKHPNGEQILTQFDLGCIFCPMAQMESLQQACEVHGIDVELLLKALNQ